MRLFQEVLFLIGVLGLVLILVEVLPGRIKRWYEKRQARRLRPGVDARYITHLTPTALFYKRPNEPEKMIDLAECGQRWDQYHHKEGRPPRLDVVGDRNVCELYILFYTDLPTYIYFKNQQAFQQAKYTLLSYGWWTYDLT